MHRQIAFVWTLFLFGACSPGPENVPANESARATVDSLMRDYVDAIVVGDWRRAISHYSQEPDFLVYTTGTPLGFDSVVSRVRKSAESRSSVELEPIDVEVTLLSDGAAVASFTHRQRIVDNRGAETVLRGSASWVWVQRDSGWKILHGSAVHLPDTIN